MRLIGRRPLTEDEDKGRMLIATNYAKKMAADMRLIDSDKYEDHPDFKVNVCARKVAELYRNSDSQRGTQIVFCDIGTPKPNAFNIYDALKEKLTRDLDIPAAQITYIHDWTDKQKPELFRKDEPGRYPHTDRQHRKSRYRPECAGTGDRYAPFGYPMEAKRTGTTQWEWEPGRATSWLNPIMKIRCRILFMRWNNRWITTSSTC
jgi:hypothetical protein